MATAFQQSCVQRIMEVFSLHRLTVIVLLAGCCGNRLHFDEFRSLNLHDQIAAYEQARESHCVGENSTAFLVAIAQHGYQAADLMTASLRGSGVKFPPDDAVTVLEFVHFGGADLRKHEALKVLEELARTAPSAALRKEAAVAVQRITTNDPMSGSERKV